MIVRSVFNDIPRFRIHLYSVGWITISVAIQNISVYEIVTKSRNIITLLTIYFLVCILLTHPYELSFVYSVFHILTGYSTQ